ncbi:unnamed protein product [Sphagnum troendelagicum]|uniref:Uncharacterized protein n=1 Tax=Sphagnum troendelagicum TaxID=128251 RepID=A0ABP0TYG6_9BRYO
MYSSTVQQVQLPCTRSDSLIDHKSSISSSSTATWRGGSSIRRSLELRASDSVIALGRGQVYSSSSHHSNWFGDECLCGE